MDVRDKHNLPRHLKENAGSNAGPRHMSRRLFFVSYLSTKRQVVIGFFMSLTLLLLVLDLTRPYLFKPFRSVFLACVTPIIRVLHWPVDGFYYLGDWVHLLSHHREMVRTLTQSNRDLAHENQLLRASVIELPELKALVNLSTDNHKLIKTVQVRTTFEDAGTFMLEGPSAEGVEENQILMTEQGVLGRITQANGSVARGTFIVSPKAKTPVVVEGRNVDGVLEGDGIGLPVLKFVDPSQIQVGDLVLTSGKGGIYPPHLKVGRIHSIQKKVRVSPFASLKGRVYGTLIRRGDA